MKRSLKITLIVLAVLIGISVGVLIAIPKIIPAYVEENSQEFLGRQVTLGEVHLNYFKLRVEVLDFMLYEANAKDVFVSFDEFNVDLKLIPSLRGDYTISSMLLDNLKVNVGYDGEHFNFDDIIVEADTSVVEAVPRDSTVEEVQFTLNNIELRNGTIRYYDSHEDIRHELSNVGFVLPAFSWDNNEASEMDLTFKFEPQGILKLKADIDYTQKRYKLTAQIIDLALAPFSAYLESMLASQGIEGYLNNTIYVNGSMDHPNDVVISGKLELRDFLLKDEKGEPIFENGLLGLYLDSIDMQNSYYGIRKVLVSEPTVYAALYETMTNFDQLLKPIMDAAAIADTVSQDEADFETTAADTVYYQIDTFQILSGALYFVDHTLNRPFKYNVTSVDALVIGVNPQASKVPVNYSLNLNKSAEIIGDAQLSMLNTEELEYSAKLKGLNLTSFSPYSEYYIARPIKRGHLNFKGKAMMSETHFQSENQIHINDIEMGAKTKDAVQIKIPIGLALGILKDKNGDVKFDVPMTGDPSDPDFNLGKIIGKTLTDFIVKIASAPFAIVGDIAGVDPERLKEIPLELAESTLRENEIETLSQIALALQEKPELVFHFTLEMPLEKEKEALAIKRLKMDYIKGLGIQEENLGAVYNALSDEDEGLLTFVNSKKENTTEASFGDHCMTIVGDEALNLELLSIENSRKKELATYLLETLKVDPTSIEIRTMDMDNNKVDIKAPRYRVELSVK